MKKIIIPEFIIIPHILIENKKITLIDERLYGIIYWFQRLKNEKCTASNPTLANLIKTTPTTIANSLTKLENLGFIKRIFKDETRKIRQEIKPLVILRKVSLTDDTVSLTDDTVSLTDDTQVSLTSEQKKNSSNKTSKKKGTGDTPPSQLAYLTNIPIQVKDELIARFILSEKELRDKAESLFLYCQSKGKVYKNYHAFLLNALKRDFKEREEPKKSWTLKPQNL